jgi:hypothetical protein
MTRIAVSDSLRSSRLNRQSDIKCHASDSHWSDTSGGHQHYISYAQLFSLLTFVEHVPVCNCPVGSKKSVASRSSLEYRYFRTSVAASDIGPRSNVHRPGFSPAPLHHRSITPSDCPDPALGTAAISDRPASHEQALLKQTHWLVLPPVHCQV